MVIAVVCGYDALLRSLDGIEGGNNETEFRAAAAALDHAAANRMHRPVVAGDSDAVVGTLRLAAPAQAGPNYAPLR